MMILILNDAKINNLFGKAFIKYYEYGVNIV